MASKNTNLKNIALCLLGLVYSSQLYAEIHPVTFKNDSDLYTKAYFGMDLNEFKTKLSSSIVACQDATKINIFADKACKVAFKTKSYGMNEALVMFKKESLISVLSKINNDHYRSVITDLSAVYKDQPQIEVREEKKGLFSSALSNEYSIWLFQDYLMMVSKFDVQKHVTIGPNFQYAIESADANSIKNLREEAWKKSKIEMQVKTANVDLAKLHQPSEPLSISSDKIIEATETELNTKSPSLPNSNVVAADSSVKNNVKVINGAEKKSLTNTTSKNSRMQNKSKVLTNNNWPLEPESFMGFRFGESFGEQISKCPSDTTVSKENIRCYETISIDAELFKVHNLANIGIPVVDITPVVKNGMFEGIYLTFRQFDYLKMYDLFKAKYGEPTKVEKITLQNRMGASFTGVECKWLGKSVNIVLSEYGSKIDEGQVTVFTHNYINTIGKESKSKAEEFKNNL